MENKHPAITRGVIRRIPQYGLLFSIIGLLSCASSNLSYNGRQAKPESLVPLIRGDAHELRWQTNDIIINGTYILEGNELNLAGQVELQSRLANFPVVDFLRVNAYAVDGDGLILASYRLWTANPGSELFFVRWTFQQQYAVPEATQTVAFSYQGRMRDGGARGFWGGLDNGGTSWDFWYTP